METEKLKQQIIELEIRLALQDELLNSLNQTVAKIHETLDLQQGQLRLLYQRLQQYNTATQHTYSLFDEIPPHY